MSIFKTAARKAALLRVLLLALSKGGKSYTSTALAFHMAKSLGIDPGRIFVIDNEEMGEGEQTMGRTELLAGEACRCLRCDGRSGLRFEGHQVAVMPDHKHDPMSQVDAINEARRQKAAILVVDGLTSEWEHVLQWVDKLQKTEKNKHAAWEKPSAAHDAFLRALLTFPGHVIATCRVKEKHEYDNGKIKSLGLLPIQRDGIEYQFDAVVKLSAGHASLESRIPQLHGRSWERAGGEMADFLLAWAREGSAAVDRMKHALLEVNERVAKLPPEERQKATDWLAKNGSDAAKVAQFLERLRSREAGAAAPAATAAVPGKTADDRAAARQREEERYAEATGGDGPAGTRANPPASGSAPGATSSTSGTEPARSSASGEDGEEQEDAPDAQIHRFPGPQEEETEAPPSEPSTRSPERSSDAGSEPESSGSGPPKPQRPRRRSSTT